MLKGVAARKIPVRQTFIEFKNYLNMKVSLFSKKLKSIINFVPVLDIPTL